MTNLGSYQSVVDEALTALTRDQIISRIWAHDHAIWQPESAEERNALGWLHSPQVMQDNVQRMQRLANEVRADGYTHVLLLGMGGASMAADLFSKIFEVGEGYLTLAVLDSTVPDAVAAYAENLDPAKTLYLVASKSGTTVETLSFFKFFYNRVVDAVGQEQAGQHFAAITDPETPLADLAGQYAFRAIFLNDPHMGESYSALSFFGLLPAALMGVDVSRLLDRALDVARSCEPSVPTLDNPAAKLGATLGELAQQGRDKVTFIISPLISAFGDWVEQLLAESLGKGGQRILPVVAEPYGLPDSYGDDRLFVYLPLAAQDYEEGDRLVQSLEEAGFPIIHQRLNDRYDLGGQFFLWEMATILAAQRLGVNPFNQPDVEAAKESATGLPANDLLNESPALRADGIAVYGNVAADSPAQALRTFLDQAQATDYVAVQAYLQPPMQLVGISEASNETHAALLSFCARLRDNYHLATTFGYGPRYLHSTGQLHKGDAGNGLFIQLTIDDALNVHIPDEAGSNATSMTFGALKTAQALTDRWTLEQSGRRIIRFHLGSDVVDGLNMLSEALIYRAESGE